MPEDDSFVESLRSRLEEVRLGRLAEKRGRVVNGKNSQHRIISVYICFSKVHHLNELRVWNYNVEGLNAIYGLREATIEYSTDGIGWTPPGNDTTTFFTMAIEDTNGKRSVVKHEEGANAVLKGQWTPWRILLSRFTGRGSNSFFLNVMLRDPHD